MRAFIGATALVYLSLVAGALAACGNSSEPDGSASGGTATQPTAGGGGASGGTSPVSESGSAAGGTAGASAMAGAAPVAGAAGVGVGGNGGNGVGGGGGSGNAGSSAGGVSGGSGGGVGAGGGGSSAEQTIVPDASWTCGKPGGIVPPTRGKLVFNAKLELGETHDVGATPLGQRRIVDVKGGSLSGEKVKATVLTGGLELELKLSNGAMELEELHVLRAEDGTLIHLRSCGVAPAGEEVVRIVPDIEVSGTSSLAWLGAAKLVGTRKVDAAAKAIELAVYDVADVAVAEPKLTLKDPSGVPHQTWDCVKAQGSQGASVFTETVTLGSSLAVGQGKNGNRNIIPITGGTVSGRLQGKVLPGGADYQIVGGATTLDARYTLAASDGELVLVRNCGAFGALIPIFEARAAGPYAFLNENAYISSNPGSAAGGVSITFYERN